MERGVRNCRRRETVTGKEIYNTKFGRGRRPLATAANILTVDGIEGGWSGVRRFCYMRVWIWHGYCLPGRRGVNTIFCKS